jgi:hypothetical protein
VDEEEDTVENLDSGVVLVFSRGSSELLHAERNCFVELSIGKVEGRGSVDPRKLGLGLGQL